MLIFGSFSKRPGFVGVHQYFKRFSRLTFKILAQTNLIRFYKKYKLEKHFQHRKPRLQVTYILTLISDPKNGKIGFFRMSDK